MKQLRIIGGQWRGSKLYFQDFPGLRPTPDRVRETLFNWLSPVIHGADCLDCFAGSGALGFEAASRGANSVTMIDQSAQVITELKKNIDRLKFSQIDVIRDVVPTQQLKNKQFDIVFLDPPFKQDLIQPICQWLEDDGLLKPESTIYIEAEKTLSPLPVPEGWKLHRSKIAGQVGYHLYCGSRGHPPT